MTTRCFYAVPLSNEIREAIASAISPYQAKISGRWISPDNWHITVLFLGFLSENDVKIAKQALGELTTTATGLMITKIDYSPGGSPRMVWAYLKENQIANSKNQKYSSLTEMRRSLETYLKNKGVRFHQEERELIPHINLVRFEPRPRRLLPALDITINQSFQPTSVVLYESKLSRQGAVYLPLAERKIE